MSRIENSLKNTAYSFAIQLLKTLLNFIYRSVVIKYMGIQVQGLNGLFTEVLAALSLAELGIGSAIVFNLYKPLAENDQKKIKQLMSLFKKAYQIIALVTFGVGTALCPFIPLIINEVSYPDYYIRIVYMLFVMNMSVSYLYSYKLSLLAADQKNYKLGAIDAITQIGMVILQIIIIIFTRNYLLYLSAGIIFTIIINIVKTKMVDKQYPWLNNQVEPLPKAERREVFANIKNIFIKSLSGKITNSTDNILISILVDTLQVGYYSNYSLIIGVFRQIANNIAYSGVGASLGNLLATESKEKCLDVFYKLLYIFWVIAMISTVGIYFCIEPFIKIWLKSDEFILSQSVLIICCLNIFIEIYNRPLWSIMEVSGLFKYDKWASIAGSLVNLIVSIVLGLKMGMVGIFIGTFLTYLIQTIIKAYLIFELKFKVHPYKYYFLEICAFGMYFGCICLSTFLCEKILLNNNYLVFLLCGVISVSITLLIIFVSSFWTEQFKYFVRMVKNIFEKYIKSVA